MGTQLLALPANPIGPPPVWGPTAAYEYGATLIY
jgi:hypothetical protein